MVSLHAGRFVVVHLYSTFLWTPRIFPYGKIYTKNYHFSQFCGCKPTTVKFGKRVQTWDSFPQAIFCKNRLREYTPFGKIYTKKIPILAILGTVLPYLLTHNNEIWHEEANLGLPPPSQILYQKYHLRGIPLLGKFIPKITNFSDFGGCKPTF